VAARRDADARLLCRTLGHAWFIVPAEREAKYGDPMWFRCERCTTERHDDVSRGDGQLYARQYVYPDGYSGYFDDMFDEAPTRSDFRRMLLTEHILKSQRRKAGAS
jgi:hypothetical protein